MSISVNATSVRWIKIAVVYWILGVALGVVMGASGNHMLYPVHAHLNLLGWASMGIVALTYALLPQIAQTKLARTHFWLHNLALPVMMVSLVGKLNGMAAVDPVLGISSVVMGVGIVLFGINVLKAQPAAS